MERGLRRLDASKKVKDIYDVLTPESFDDVSLPELPDLRMIELEAQRELEKEIPPPKMKLVDGINIKRKEIEAYRHELREQLESDGPTRTASPKIYQTSIGKNGTTSAGKEVELKGTRVSLPLYHSMKKMNFFSLKLPLLIFYKQVRLKRREHLCQIPPK